MSVLPDHEIEHFARPHRNGEPLITDFNLDQLQPASYDVKLASPILVPKTTPKPIDLREPAESRSEPHDISSGYMLMPYRFVLAATEEWVNVPNYLVGRIEGKSSRARQGLQIHSAGYLDPGFRGNVTLELVNFDPTAPVILWPGILIAQLSFEYLHSPASNPYSSTRNHYQDSHGAIDSRAGHE